MRSRDLWFVPWCYSARRALTKGLQKELNAETSAIRDKQQDLQDQQRLNAAESSRWKREIDRVNAEYEPFLSLSFAPRSDL